MKRIIAVALILVLIISLCSCSLIYEYQNNAVGSFDVGYSKMLNNAFLGTYHWDGSEEGMNIILPEKYNNATITGLGGYCGTGVPSPFEIYPTKEARAVLCDSATSWSGVYHTATLENYNIESLRFHLHITEYIKELKNFSAGEIILAEYEENGEIKYNVYVLTCFVTCDENNKVFYAKDGKLYYREDNALVEDIIYEDFNLDMHNEENKDKPYKKYTFSEDY